MNKFLPKQIHFGWYMTSVEAQTGLDDIGHITKKTDQSQDAKTSGLRDYDLFKDRIYI
jgi:hypothetical protein